MSNLALPHHRHESHLYFRKFTLNELGIDSAAFLAHIGAAYEALRWDMYDMIRGGLTTPTRQRALAEFLLEKEGSDWRIRRVPAQSYVQPTDHGDYNRTEPRSYPEVPDAATNHPEVEKFQKIADMVEAQREDAKKIRMIFTFLRTVDEEGRSGKCALEGGPHIDGMDYIVSALVINRKNLLPHTGESSVYTLQKEQLTRSVLQPGEGIFQDDIHLMHHITDIRRDVPSERGIRDILGVDVLILPSS